LIWGIVQETQPEEFPEKLSGFVRVDGWQRATAKQYLQVVVIVFGADNGPQGVPNYQIRYILHGIDRPPFEISNARYVFIDTGEPVDQQWFYFERNVAEDFRNLWGVIPAGYDNIRLLYEVRYDDKAPTELPAADVYYDDLGFGATAPGP
jgi:hypothetical protein